ncbi:MAG: hypothetical protein OXB93_05125, partial [Cytophagales bacterium]|nr:hypothetical protein [Cytophagales bacterium]
IRDRGKVEVGKLKDVKLNGVQVKEIQKLYRESSNRLHSSNSDSPLQIDLKFLKECSENLFDSCTEDIKKEIKKKYSENLSNSCSIDLKRSIEGIQRNLSRENKKKSSPNTTKPDRTAIDSLF